MICKNSFIFLVIRDRSLFINHY